MLHSHHTAHNHPTFMVSPGSNLTQVQSGVTLPLTNPDIQGYAIRLSSECILRPCSAQLWADLGFIFPFSEYNFMAHLCVGEFLGFLFWSKGTHNRPALLIACSTKTQRRFLLSYVALAILVVWLCRGRSDHLNRSDITFAIVQTPKKRVISLLNTDGVHV